MKKVKYRQTVTWSGGDGGADSGRGEYYLKMPHEFPSSNTNKLLDKTDDMNKANEYPPLSGGQGLGHGQQEIQDAANKLQNLLPRQTTSPTSVNGNPREEIVQRRLPASPVRGVKIQQSSAIHHHHQEYQEPEVNIENQPYRTTPLVLPHAKTIHDTNQPGNKYVSSVRDHQDQTPYRSSSLLMPGPKTIHEVKVGGPSFQPYRGPQYYAEKGYVPVPVNVQATQYFADTNLVTKPHSNIYNSPAGLYGDEALAEALHGQNLNNERGHTGHGGHGGQDAVNQEFTPIAVTHNASNTRVYQPPSKTGGAPHINQSSSFKKVMYSVMRDSEF